MKFQDRVLLNIANNEDCFGIYIGRDSHLIFKEKWNLTFQEAIEYIEENFSNFYEQYGKYEPIFAGVYAETGDPIVSYNGKEWEL